jgi:hypothetical protein
VPLLLQNLRFDDVAEIDLQWLRSHRLSMIFDFDLTAMARVTDDAMIELLAISLQIIVRLLATRHLILVYNLLNQNAISFNLFLARWRHRLGP